MSAELAVTLSNINLGRPTNCPAQSNGDVFIWI